MDYGIAFLVLIILVGGFVVFNKYSGKGSPGSKDQSSGGDTGTSAQ